MPLTAMILRQPCWNTEAFLRDCPFHRDLMGINKGPHHAKKTFLRSFGRVPEF